MSKNSVFDNILMVLSALSLIFIGFMVAVWSR